LKSLFPKVRLTSARWNVLTVLLVSLTGMVCLVYGVIFLNPRVLPMQLQVPTKALTQTSPTVSAGRATRPFPTFPAEWTAVYATRFSQAATLTPTPLGSSSQGATPVVSSTVAATLPEGTAATLEPFTPTPTSPSPIAPEATITSTGTAVTTVTPGPSPATPLPTDTPEGYTGYPLPTSYPYP
jgi:hypothetical protein